MRKVQKIKLICPECGMSFERYPSQPHHVDVCCSRSCARKHYEFTDEHRQAISRATTGEGNPAYGGHQWNNARRESHSKMMEEFMQDPHRRYVSGNANRDKKFTEERRAAMAAAHLGLKYASPSPKRRKEIGKQSKKNWQNPDFRKRVIEGGSATKEAKGLIIPRSRLPDWKFYWREANWKFGFQYTIKTNLRDKGICRDHIVGRKQGFDLKIFPEILRHPENCQIVSWKENGKKARRPADSTQPKLLMERILAYSGNYPDHHHTVELVQKYLNGEHWAREIK